jgi:hypothetical protein
MSLQIKGLRLSPSSLVSIRAWTQHQEGDSDLEDEVSCDERRVTALTSRQDRVDAAEQYRKKMRETMEKQKDSMGHCCRLCGMVFLEGAEVDDPSYRHLSLAQYKTAPRPSTVVREVDDESGEQGAKSIPCYGYRITDRMAYSLAGLHPPRPASLLSSNLLAAIYRDNGLSITPYAREMLLEEAQYSQVGLVKPPVSLADGTVHRPRRKRLGTIEVCIHCIQVRLPTLGIA